MTNKDLANIIFPDIDKSIEYYENLYPKRNLNEKCAVTRFAPSPTGFMHIGNFQSAVIDYVLARNTNGVFYLRNEDTDSKREIEGAMNVIFDTLKNYDMVPDEYEFNGKVVGNYGPYIQSERKEIYHTFIKYLIEIGRAYPCFCTKEELDEMRKVQESSKRRIGYYGRYAVCRRLNIDEAIEKIKSGIPYVIRFKSEGDFDNKIHFEDEVRGRISIPENDQDIVIMKSSNKLPTYHFAHFVDDYLMRTTHVVRGEEWLPSVPIHLELFKTFNAVPPKYIHTPLILKKDGDTIRKISKRKDPEASMSYYKEKGYPKEALIESLMTIINSNYEQWHTANPEKSYLDFEFSAKKMSSTGGALYDIEKLNNISKNYISKLKAIDVYNGVLEWSKEYDLEFYNILSNNKDYSISIFNIEREQKKPRKDYAAFSEVKSLVWYMYDELFDKEEKNYEFSNITDKDEILRIMKTYIEKYYDEADEQQTWFEKIKDLSKELGYAREVKEYKANPDNYKGHVGDISMVIRVALTTKAMTPNLYDIMKLFGRDRILKRIEELEKNF
ncbi:MAG: glutamate--tRNA ligase [Tenericutes bacterium]|nr:glutamate--tRNA ligase [Mycoplasmatota bacterium]